MLVIAFDDEKKEALHKVFNLSVIASQCRLPYVGEMASVSSTERFCLCSSLCSFSIGSGYRDATAAFSASTRSVFSHFTPRSSRPMWP